MRREEKELIKKCINEAEKRVFEHKNKMNAFEYVTYFSRRHGLSFQASWTIKKALNEFIDKNFDKLFVIDFTVNNKKI